MYLTKITIDSFKTVATSQDLLLDPRATILVGANESGKTNVLQAIEFLTPLKELKKEDISKYNQEKCAQRELPCISFSFLPDKEEIKKIAKIFPEVTDQDPITIRRDGNGINSYSIIVSSEKLLPKLTDIERKLVDEKENLKKQLETIDSEMNKISTESTAIARKSGDVISPSDKKLQEKYEKIFREKSEKRTQILNEIEILENKILKNDLRKSLAKDNILSASVSEVNKILDLLPQAIYLGNFELIPDSIPIKDVKEQKTPVAKIVGNLLKLGKIYNFSDLDEDHRRLKPILKGASAIITGKFRNFWSQEEIDIEIEKQSNDLAFSINGGVSVSSPPQERSEGFRWLLSFFSHFANEHKLTSGNTIYLIDEPAVLLHPKGQKDVLNILENIADNNQIVYSTHSPFLINKNFPQRIRLLTKDAEKGTIINNKPYSDGKVRFFWEPLKSSIGVSFGDLLSIGEVNLIVEGVSDQIFIANISRKVAKLNLNYPFIDLEKVSIVPAMGATCEEFLARFALSEKFEAIFLLDNDSQGKRVRKRLQKDEQIKFKLISINDIKKDAVTIEDLFPEEIYVNAVNAVYSRFDDKFKEYRNEDEKETTPGIVAKIEKHLKNLDCSGLDKVAVAKELIQNLEISEENISQYDHFKELFIMINKLQPKVTA